MTTRQQISNATVKAASKVMGWGMILKMIRDKNVTWGTRVETVTGGTDQEHWVL
jgi:hypothetical protein